MKFSYLLVDFPEIVEMDANPVQVRTDGLCVLDARLVIEPKDVRKITLPGSHLMISMYPASTTWDETIDGEKVELRAIRPEDEPLWAEMIESLSPETAEYRFFGPVKEITKSMVVRYCHIDYDREIALVAMRRPRASASARCSASPVSASRPPTPRRASSPSSCATTYQRKGLGGQLMDTLIQAARDRHVREINGDVLAANARMQRFAESLGFEILPGGEPDVRKMVLRL